MTVLVLSGTREGRDMAKAIAARCVSVIASLAGATRAPRDQSVPTRIGGFGGADGYLSFLRAHKISAVLDATHPFAVQITARSAALAAQSGVPYGLFSRPPWEPEPGDLWTELACEEEASQIIEKGATVFLATGRQSLMRFTGLEHCHLICRQIDPPDQPFPWKNGRYLIGNPPFSIEDEEQLFEKLKVDWLVVKNAGGAASQSKLIAARNLGLRVALIARPPLPQAVVFDQQDQAVEWAVQQR